jgi:hypothetical protein
VSSFDALLGAGGPAQQLLIYGVGYEIARALLGPLFTQIEYDINQNSPITELSPAELADLVVRGVIANEPDAAARAQVYGLNAAKFQEMVQLAGEPVALEQVLAMWRRGIIQWDEGIGVASVAEAIRTSRIYTYWTQAIQNFQFTPIPPADAVNAVLRNQVDLATGIALAYFGGLGNTTLTVPAGADTTATTSAFNILLDSRGNPPSLGELLELAKRGDIAWGDLDPATKTPNPDEISFAQGIYEGDSKDKWLPYYAMLKEYLPPPRTVTTLLRSGAITVAQATTYYEQAGLSTALADAYIASASSSKVSSAKNLNETTIVQLYLDKLVDEALATANLEALGYTASEANLLLQSAGLRQTIADLNKNIARIGTYYIAYKIDEATARTMLTNLGLPADQVDQYLTGWTIDRQANVRLLTPAQIAEAWEYGVFTQDDAQLSLEQYGYTPFDAYTLLSIKAKIPLPNPPARGPAPVR